MDLMIDIMQAKIKRSELEAFKSQAAFILPAKNNMPILSYLKFEVKGDFCELMKSNGESFCIRRIPVECEDCEFLVDEKILYSFMEFCSAETYTFETEGNRIKISGNTQVTRSPTENSKAFLRLQQHDETWAVIPKTALVSVGIACNFIFDTEFKSVKNYVFVGAEAVIGMDGNIGFQQRIKEPLPELVLRKEVAVCISKMANCEHSKNSSYDFFKDGDTTFGFLKNEFNFVNLNYVYEGPNGIDVDAFHFTVSKSFLIKFNSHCINSRTDNTCAATFIAENNYLKLELVDSKNEFDVKDEAMIKDCKGKFKFNPEYMNKVLKSIQCENVYFYSNKLENMYFITDIDRSFLSAIMLIG